MAQTTTVSFADADIANWKGFLKKTVNSFVKWDLVRFFHDNPHTTDTADNIAQFVGREPAVVRRELDALVEANVIERKQVEGIKVYRLASDKDMRDTITRFVNASHDREFRIQAINHVISVMRTTNREL